VRRSSVTFPVALAPPGARPATRPRTVVAPRVAAYGRRTRAPRTVAAPEWPRTVVAPRVTAYGRRAPRDKDGSLCACTRWGVVSRGAVAGSRNGLADQDERGGEVEVETIAVDPGGRPGLQLAHWGRSCR